MKIAYILFLCCCFGIQAVGQDLKTKLYDMAHDLEYRYYLIGEKGYLRVDKQSEEINKTFKRRVVRFNNEDQALNEYSINGDYDLKLGPSIVDEDGVFIVTGSGYGREGLGLLILETEGYEFKQFPFDNMYVSEYHKIGDKLLIAGADKSRPLFFNYDLTEKRLKPFESLYNKGVRLEQWKINKSVGVVNILTLESGEYKLRNFNLDGEILSQYNLSYDLQRKKIRAIRLSNVVGGNQYVVGTYADKQTQLNTGIFVFKLGVKQSLVSQFTPFFELDGFFHTNGVSEKKSSQLAQRAYKKWQRSGTWATAREWWFSSLRWEKDSLVFYIDSYDGPKYRYHDVYLDTRTLELKIRKSEGIETSSASKDFERKHIYDRIGGMTN